VTPSRSDLVEHLQVLAEDLDRAPLPDDVIEAGKYTAEVYYEVFDSWYGAVLCAGLDRPIWPSLPEKELLGELHRLKRVLDKVPSEEDMAERGGYGVSTYWSSFGSWNAAIEAAGWQPNSDRTQRSEEDLLDELYRLRDELGKVPTSRDMDEHGAFSRGTYRNRWGSWNDALEAAGLTPQTEGEKISRNDLLEELRRLADELGRQPSTSDMDEQGAYSDGVYYSHFDSWSAALEAADLTSPDHTR
jgi:hypothetical protein